MLIGEIYLPIERLVAYYGRELGGLHLPFNFALLRTPWRARTIAALIDEYEWALPPGGWPNWVLGNHDRSRIAQLLLQGVRRTQHLFREGIDVEPRYGRMNRLLHIGLPEIGS